MPFRCSAFGLDITSRLPLPGHWRSRGAGLPALAIEPSSAEAIAQAWTDAASLGWRGWTDGCEFVAEQGAGGDLRMRLAGVLDAHLSGDGSRLLVAGADGVAGARTLLDSVLFTVSLRHGYEALHAGAVTTDAGVLAVAGAAGTGKSSLVSALLAAGCGFFTDDVLVLSRDGIAMPGPPLMTVPNAVRAGLGELLADLGDESWLAVTGAEASRRLAGIVQLGDDAGWSSLLRMLLRFPRTREREASRFELAAQIADKVPVHGIAPRSAAPDRLAADALEWIRSLGGR